MEPRCPYCNGEPVSYEITKNILKRNLDSGQLFVEDSIAIGTGIECTDCRAPLNMHYVVDLNEKSMIKTKQ